MTTTTVRARPTAVAEGGGAPAGALAATRATAFLRAQAQWLQRGLERGGDPVAVDIVLSAHDRSHDRWVGVIAGVYDGLGDEAAGEVVALYAHFGRVAGALERAATQLLSPSVAADVRRQLGARLGERTEDVVESLWSAAAAG